MSDNRVSPKTFQNPALVAREEYIELVIKQAQASRRNNFQQFSEFAWRKYTTKLDELAKPYGGTVGKCTYGPRNDHSGNCRAGMYDPPDLPPEIVSAWEFMLCAHDEVVSTQLKSASEIVALCDKRANWSFEVKPPTTEGKRIHP